MSILNDRYDGSLSTCLHLPSDDGHFCLTNCLSAPGAQVVLSFSFFFFFNEMVRP